MSLKNPPVLHAVQSRRERRGCKSWYHAFVERSIGYPGFSRREIPERTSSEQQLSSSRVVYIRVYGEARQNVFYFLQTYNIEALAVDEGAQQWFQQTQIYLRQIL